MTSHRCQGFFPLKREFIRIPLRCELVIKLDEGLYMFVFVCKHKGKYSKGECEEEDIILYFKSLFFWTVLSGPVVVLRYIDLAVRKERSYRGWDCVVVCRYIYLAVRREAGLIRHN